MYFLAFYFLYAFSYPLPPQSAVERVERAKLGAYTAANAKRVVNVGFTVFNADSRAAYAHAALAAPALVGIDLERARVLYVFQKRARSA